MKILKEGGNQTYFLFKFNFEGNIFQVALIYIYIYCYNGGM